MKYSKHISLIILISIILAGCQASVRYTSEKVSPNQSQAKSTQTNKLKTPTTETKKFPIINQSSLNTKQVTILKEIERWLGTPYCWGGASKNCTDCSGFVREVFNTVGVTLPRTAQEQFNFLRNVSEKDLTVGDLVFFKNNIRISHVGIYVGNNEFVHASSSRGVIRQSLSNQYHQDRFAGYKRAIK